jgi:hypothetical protein
VFSLLQQQLVAENAVDFSLNSLSNGRYDTSYPRSVINALSPMHDDDESRCDVEIDEPTLLIQRYEYANMYHQWTDWHNAHTVHVALNLTAMRIELFDGHRASPLDIVWQAAFGMSHVVYLF